MHLNISPSRKLKCHCSCTPVRLFGRKMGENWTKATLLTFSPTKLDGVQTEILYHVLTRARGAADTVSQAWNLHHWASNEEYSVSESDCSAAGQISTHSTLSQSLAGFHSVLLMMRTTSAHRHGRSIRADLSCDTTVKGKEQCSLQWRVLL